VHQKTGAGIQAISIHRNGSDYRITMRQGPISFGEPITNELRERIAAALGLTSRDFVESLPVQVNGNATREHLTVGPIAER
jgi:predicted PhzF superfamily epimerase YddE/YHI9